VAHAPRPSGFTSRTPSLASHLLPSTACRLTGLPLCRQRNIPSRGSSPSVRSTLAGEPTGSALLDRGGWRRHRRHPNRHEVTVRFRVSLAGDVAGASGCLLPVRPRRSQTPWPFRCSCHQPRPRMRLRWRSSRAVQPSFTVCPDRPRLASLDVRHLSWGFTSLQRSRWRESTSAPVARLGCACRSHPADYGAAHRFSQPLSDFFLSPPSHHFQAGGAPGIHPSGS
jgi:hypothetical protein